MFMANPILSRSKTESQENCADSEFERMISNLEPDFQEALRKIPNLREFVNAAPAVRGLEGKERLQALKSLLDSNVITPAVFSSMAGSTLSRMIERIQDADPEIIKLNGEIDQIEKSSEESLKSLLKPIEEAWELRLRELKAEIQRKVFGSVLV
jgi:hypothetical protein